MLTERKKHLLNVVAGQSNMLAFTAGSLVVTPAVVGALGDSRYGGWLLINSYIQYLRMLDLGTSAGTMKFGAGAHKRGDTGTLRSVLDTSAAMFLSIGGLAAVATVLLAVLLPLLFPSILGNQHKTILILGAAGVIDLVFRPFSAALRMRSYHFIHDAIETGCYAVFKLGLVLYFAYADELDYRILALLTLGEYGTRIFLVVISTFVITPYIRHMNPLRAQRAMVRKLATMGAAVSVIMVADVVRFQLDATVIGAFIHDAATSIAIFGIGTRLPTIAYAAIGVIGNTLVPRFSGLAETNDRAGMLSLLRGASLAQGLVTAFVLVSCAVLGPHFLGLWLDNDWIGTSAHVMIILLPGYYIALLSGPATALLIGRGKLRGLTILTVAEAAVNLGLSIALVGPLGVYGVALGTTIPLALFRGVVFPYLLWKEIDFSPREYMKLHTPALLVGFVMLVCIFWMVYIPVHTWTRLVVSGVGVLVLFGVLAMLLTPPARKWVQGKLRRFRRRGPDAEAV